MIPASISDSGVAELIEYHKAECMRYRGRGQCTTHGCLTRGGYERGKTPLPIDPSIATCEAHETVLALEELASNRESAS